MRRFFSSLERFAANRVSLRRIAGAALFAALGLSAGCSHDSPAAAAKPPVTLDPDVFEADHPEIFRTSKAETRQLPSQVTANGVVTPDGSLFGSS